MAFLKSLDICNLFVVLFVIKLKLQYLVKNGHNRIVEKIDLRKYYEWEKGKS